MGPHFFRSNPDADESSSSTKRASDLDAGLHGGLLWVKIQIDTRMMVMSKLSLDYAFISA
jgi:hypothetical protein